MLLPLLEAVAVNTLLECWARGTPVLVPPLPAVAEYLGEDYPGYYRNDLEAEQKLADPQVLRGCHEYLLNRDTTRLTYASFLEQVKSSLSIGGESKEDE